MLYVHISGQQRHYNSIINLLCETHGHVFVLIFFLILKDQTAKARESLTASPAVLAPSSWGTWEKAATLARKPATPNTSATP